MSDWGHHRAISRGQVLFSCICEIFHKVSCPSGPVARSAPSPAFKRGLQGSREDAKTRRREEKRRFMKKLRDGQGGLPFRACRAKRAEPGFQAGKSLGSRDCVVGCASSQRRLPVTNGHLHPELGRRMRRPYTYSLLPTPYLSPRATSSSKAGVDCITGTWARSLRKLAARSSSSGVRRSSSRRVPLAARSMAG